MSSPILAIDVGLSHLCMSLLHADGRARVVPNAEGHDTTPAAVHFYAADGAVIGQEAVQVALLESEFVVTDVTRYLAADRRFTFFERTWTPQELMALVLRKLREDAEGLRGEPITRAVLALPSFFDSAERAALAEAATLAGLEVLSTVPCATAALIGTGLDDLPSSARILVVDVRRVGVEATLIRREGDTLTVLSTSSDPEHGIEAWERYVSGLLWQRWRAAHPAPAEADTPGAASTAPPSSFAEPVLRPVLSPVDDEAEIRQVIALSAADAVARLMRAPTASAGAGIGDRRVHVELEREAFTRDTWNLVVRAARTARTCVEKSPDRKLPDEIVLVGAGCRLPGLRRSLTLALKSTPRPDELPHTTTARGAAWLAATRHDPDHQGLHERARASRPAPTPAGVPAAPEALRGATIGLADGGHFSPILPATTLRIEEVTARALGMLGLDADGSERVIELIPEGTRLPARFRGRFRYAYDNMTSVRVEVTEGQGATRDQVRVIGAVELTGLPPRPRGTPIDVTYRYGEDQILQVEVTDVATSKVKKVEIAFRGSLSKNERDEAIRRAAKVQVG